MDGPIAYWNGELLPAAQVAVPVHDTGFVQGVTVAEQLRTFGHRLFCLDEHLERLMRSLQIIGLGESVDVEALRDIALRVARHNCQLLAPESDLGLCIFASPGSYAALASEVEPTQRGPKVCMHTYPISFELWADKYTTGQALVTTSIRQIPVNCWPAELKCRSRMHYYLADREAAAAEPDARALLLDQDGFVAEASTANVVAVSSEGRLVSPPREKILPGISLAVTAQLAEQLGVETEYRDLTVEELMQSPEVLMASTSVCLLSVVQVNGQAIGAGQPGPMFERLISAWSQRVGLDVRGQAASQAR